MNPIKEYKHYIVIVLITIVLGYFLGITVSSVVDYRLKDAVINIPRQKNNIVVKLDDYNLNEAFKGHKSPGKSKKSPGKAKKATNKSKKSHRKAKKSTKKTSKKKTKHNTDKGRTEPEFFENFTSSPEDPNLVEYSKLYKASSKQQAVPYFKAANEEANAQYYQTIN
tara:strand:- start:904 stop:1404 length:501 start_codon:yes stop_codon:yes gene_type:complete